MRMFDRKYRAAVLAAALIVLSGCQDKNARTDMSIPKMSVASRPESSSSAASPAGNSAPEQQESSADNSQSAEESGEDTAPSAAESSESTASSETSSPAEVSSGSSYNDSAAPPKDLSVIGETDYPSSGLKVVFPVAEKGASFIMNDPRTAIQVKLDGNKVLLSGKIGEAGLDKIMYDKRYELSLAVNGDEFTAVIDCEITKDCFASFYIFDKNDRRIDCRLKVKDGKLYMPDVSDVVEKNRSVVKKTVEQPLDQVSEYVVIGSDPARVKEILTEIKRMSNEICAGLTNDYDKLRAISWWVSDNIYYDRKSFADGVPAETLTLDYMLRTNAGVCGSFSNMTAALAAAQGIKIYNVHGGAITGYFCYEEGTKDEYHEWNYAIINGRVVWIDTGLNSHNKLDKDGVYDKNPITYKYFDTGEEFFAQDHKAQYAEHRDYFALLK